MAQGHNKDFHCLSILLNLSTLCAIVALNKMFFCISQLHYIPLTRPQPKLNIVTIRLQSPAKKQKQTANALAGPRRL